MENGNTTFVSETIFENLSGGVRWHRLHVCVGAGRHSGWGLRDRPADSWRCYGWQSIACCSQVGKGMASFIKFSFIAIYKLDIHVITQLLFCIVYIKSRKRSVVYVIHLTFFLKENLEFDLIWTIYTVKTLWHWFNMVKNLN